MDETKDQTTFRTSDRIGNHLLWYTWPASKMQEALPLGNGRLGAMMYGGARHERLSLNEDTLWSGYPAYYSNPEAYNALLKARKLILAGDLAQGQRELEQHYTSLWPQAYLPLGKIDIDQSLHGEVREYRRQLDLETGIAEVSFRCADVRYTRECFISSPDQVLVLQLKADQPGKLNFNVTLTPGLKAETASFRQTQNDPFSGLCFEGNAPSYEWTLGDNHDLKQDGVLVYSEDPRKKGMYFYAELRIRIQSGQADQNCGSIAVTGADSAVLYFNARTSFSAWNRHPVLEKVPYVEPCRQELAQAVKCPYEQLRDRAVSDYRKLYDRVSFDLGGGNESLLPTDERLYRHEQGGEDLSLYVLFFNYARYLTISGSREGTQAMNLQGIWNEDPCPPWSCDYTVNINTEMNYWPTLGFGLPECEKPLLRMIKELSESGRRTAEEYFHAPGFVAHHNTDLWRMTTPVGAHREGTAEFAFWPMASGWLVRHVYDYMDYTRDFSCLKQEGWSMIRSAAEFYLSEIIQDENGQWMLSPATSPENTFMEKGKVQGVSETTAMTQEILEDVLRITVKCAQWLGIDQTDPVAERASEVIPDLRPLQIGGDGRLVEWDKPRQETDIHHRHVSHLYGIYPADLISIRRDPKLVQAARKSLLVRGDESTGWAMGWRICLWAQLGDGDHALSLLDTQLRAKDGYQKDSGGCRETASTCGGTYLNLFDAHPPFQIDGNFGAAAGILQMLLRTDPDTGEPVPLPARPSSWVSGTLHGVCTRGGWKVDLDWQGDTIKMQKYIISQGDSHASETLRE